MIKAEIICDSMAPSGVRLTTFVLTYPRFIHSEFMTHRVFSRNASSSRAIPVKKQIQMVIDNPAIPLAFTKNQKGMQGGELLENQDAAIGVWLQARDFAVGQAKAMMAMDIHKQFSNRILEPFAHITVVCTATDWDNFFALRCHSDAQPEIHALADAMYDLYSKNQPKQLPVGGWHLPFINENLTSTFFDELVNEKRDGNGWSADLNCGWKVEDDTLIKRSVAKCARVSYLNHDGTQSTIGQDLQLYDRLVNSVPMHLSPSEHQAMAFEDPEERSGNFRGWIQYRQTLRNQNVTNFTPNKENK